MLGWLVGGHPEYWSALRSIPAAELTSLLDTDLGEIRQALDDTDQAGIPVTAAGSD